MDIPATCSLKTAVISAAEWLRHHRLDQRKRALIPDMKARFGISTKQVIEAIRLSYQEEDRSAPS